jgi:prepilin-type N-terminal cleavage/methylation domain-containing protein
MKAHVPGKSAPRAAFTLIELLVVIGLMAMLGTISVTGYFSAVRGMSDRAALQDTISLMRQARQVCLIDQAPTAVLFYNRQIEASDSGTANPASAGTAVAIKMVGRVSYFNDNIILDEFADWTQSYPMRGKNANDEDSGMRFYRMSDLEQNVAGGIDKCSSIVSTYVVPVSEEFKAEKMISANLQVYQFCNTYKKNGSDNKKFSGSDMDNGNDYRWGHRVTKSNGLQWKIGDAYGVEIGSLTLPKGYIYGTPGNKPGESKIESIPSLSFDPRDATGYNDFELSPDRTIQISALRPSGYKAIGSITKKDLSDDEQVKD